MTLADINAELLECAAFDNPPDLGLARRYIVAARQWLHVAADSSSNQSSSMTIGKQHVADMMKYAQAFVAANTSTGSVTFLQPGGFFR